MINYEVKEFLTYATMIFIGVTFSTIGDMMIFHMIKLKKGNKCGIYFLSLSNYIFGMAIITLKPLIIEEYIWIGVICVVSFILLYILKKIVMRRVYGWSIFYGQGIMLMVAGAIFISFHNITLGLIAIISVIPAVTGGVLIILRSFFNVRFQNMAISLWTMYMVQLLILTYSPIIIVLNRV